jgi:hypothetical protein
VSVLLRSVPVTEQSVVLWGGRTLYSVLAYVAFKGTAIDQGRLRTLVSSLNAYFF